MAIYHYRCKDCDFDFEAINQLPSKPQTICPNCNKNTLKIIIDSIPQVRGKDHYTKGGKEALMYRDLNKKYKKKASYINQQLQRDAAV